MKDQSKSKIEDVISALRKDHEQYWKENENIWINLTNISNFPVQSIEEQRQEFHYRIEFNHSDYHKMPEGVRVAVQNAEMNLRNQKLLM
jgi:hypothetical protein